MSGLLVLVLVWEKQRYRVLSSNHGCLHMYFAIALDLL